MLFDLKTEQMKQQHKLEASARRQQTQELRQIALTGKRSQRKPILMLAKQWFRRLFQTSFPVNMDEFETESHPTPTLSTETPQTS